jgi:hypothetical protein
MTKEGEFDTEYTVCYADDVHNRSLAAIIPLEINRVKQASEGEGLCTYERLDH